MLACWFMLMASWLQETPHILWSCYYFSRKAVCCERTWSTSFLYCSWGIVQSIRSYSYSMKVPLEPAQTCKDTWMQVYIISYVIIIQALPWCALMLKRSPQSWQKCHWRFALLNSHKETLILKTSLLLELIKCINSCTSHPRSTSQ